MKIIKIDIDGVLRNLLPKMCDLYNQAFKTDIKVKDIVEYELDKTFTKCKEIDNISANEWFFINCSCVLNRFSPILENAQEAMRLLHQKGYYIIIVSYQKTYQQQTETLDWLNNHYIFYDSICFTKRKDLIIGDIVVDDNIEFLDICNEKRKICIDAPYNVNKHNYEHYKSLYDFVKTLE